MKKQVKGRKKPPIILFLFLSLLIIVFLSGLLVWIVVIREYQAWEKDFESSLEQNRVVNLENESLKNSSRKKLESFSKSTKKVDFVELSDLEFVYVLGESLNSSLPIGMKFEKGYVISQPFLWNIYVKTKINRIPLPWVLIKIEKDNTESAQIFVNSMSVGNFDFTDYGFRKVLENINKGIRDALVLVNESDFTGRVFRNIELETGKIIIKGEL